LKVGIIARLENQEEERPFHKKYIIHEVYREILDELNIVIIPILSTNNLEEVTNLCDALILPGSFIGVDPKYYNDVPFPGKEYPYDEYKLDKQVIDLFIAQKKPIIGICGGMQTLNVYFGGDLNQNINHHKLTDGTKHKIKIDTKSFLYDIYQKQEIEVNSYHRQAIRKLAPNFQVVATSEDGIIEAIQDRNIIGVQWHPEVLNDVAFFKKIFEGFGK